MITQFVYFLTIFIFTNQYKSYCPASIVKVDLGSSLPREWGKPSRRPSRKSFMIEILQRCQHNNTTTNVHFNGSLRRIKFFIPSASLNELPAPTCLWTLGWCRLQIALLFVQLFDWSSLEYFPSVLTNMNCYNDTLSPQLQEPCHGAVCDNGGVTRVTSCQIKMMNPSTIHSSLLISALCAVFIVYFWN